MNPFDENSNPLPPQEPAQAAQDSIEDLAARIVVHPPDPGAQLSGDPMSFAALVPPPAEKNAFLPEDLRVSWGWLHLFFFGLFAIGSLIVIQTAIVIYFSIGQPHMTQKQMEAIFQSKPGVAIGSNVAWFFLIVLFLYVTLAVLHERPFWATLKWKKLNPEAKAPSKPWIYFAGGIGLAVCVAVLSSRLKTPENLPIQELFKNRVGAMLLMSMAVFVAPFVEETVFRGYLYPLFASSFSRASLRLGSGPEEAVKKGTWLGILLTGALFGLMHGVQLGWTWGLVALLTAVGIIFTYARARAGTVLASFLLHLGYNSLIAVTSIIATRGFTHMPPHP